MIELKHYIVTEILDEGAVFVVCRAVRRRDGLAVRVKTFRSETPSPRKAELLRRECEISRQLDSAFVFKPLELDIEELQPVLVFADTGGESLARLTGRPIETGKFLDIAFRLADAVADVHRLGFIHKDIKPANILIPPNPDGMVQLTGFGIAAPSPRLPGPAPPSTLIEGSLPYMSPEQSGRMNRAIDYRSDLYSLGITFYEMLTGDPPFQAADPLEWVHCHIARQPRAPAQILPSIPEQLSAIVMKLIAKQAEHRYQSAHGLHHDLRRCRDEWLADGRISPFPLGREDVSEQFLPPWKLYGRSEETTRLLEAFGRVINSGLPELILVSGKPGIGKSALVQALAQPILQQRGYFISGKFEEHRRDIPYESVRLAVGELIRQVLSESDERIRHLREELRKALGDNGGIITDTFPQAGLLLGEQPPAPELPALEARKRFQLLFTKFIGVFAQKEQPLVMFLDDLQWLDQASLALVTALLTDIDSRCLLLLGAYRDTEVYPSHPLMVALTQIKAHGAPVHEIVLGPLTCSDLTQLIADTVHRPVETVEPLAQLVHAKTGGNPFFAVQFLTTLYQEGLLGYAAQQGQWRWNLEEIRGKGFTDNLAELMVARLKRVPSATLEVMKLAACIGTAVEFRVLALICDRSQEWLHGVLGAAVDNGLMFHRETSCRFLHDRVREAAYELVPRERRADLHLMIGRRLLAGLSPTELKNQIFEVVSQLNFAIPLVTEKKERLQLASLNLRGARKAKAATAYQAAMGYLEAAVALLGSDGWEARHDLAFTIHLELSRCCLLNGEFDRAESSFPLLLQRARSRLAKARVYLVQIDTLNLMGRGTESIDTALECLRLFDINMSAHPSRDDVREAHEAIWSHLGEGSIEALIDLPPMTDPGLRIAMEVLSRLYIPAYYADNNLFYLHICRAVELSLAHGNCAASTYAYGWFGVLLAATFYRPREGYRFGKMAYDLMEHRRYLSHKPEALMNLKFIAYWSQSLDKEVDYARAMFEAGVAAGDVASACFSFPETLFGMISRGDDLAAIQQEAERGLDYTGKAGFRDVSDLISSISRFVQAMRGRTRHLASYDDDRFSEADFEAGLDQKRMPTLVFYHHAVKLMARYLAGDFEAALVSGDIARSLHWAGLFSACSHYFTVYYALTLAAVHAELSPAKQQESLAILSDHQEQLRKWARNSPGTFQHAYDLVSAEIARITDKETEAEQLYEQAVLSAHQNGFVHDEAVASELAARFHRARGLTRIGDFYLREARNCYQRWGAEGKVRQLDRYPPHLLESRPLDSPLAITVASEQLDLLSVIKASQSISREILLPDLQRTLMRLVLEQSGAQRAFLLMADDEGLQVQAWAETRADSTQFELTPVLPVSTDSFPMSIINLVMRTGEAVVQADAAGEAGYTTDRYISRFRPRSVLCLPIVRQAGIVGLLYLENNLTAGAFTAHTLTTLDLLAAQAAISLESASLYLNLQKENADRRRAEAELRQHREHLEELVALRTTELAAAKARAEEADRLKSSFLATMSHELRTPLNSIIGFTGIMLQGMVGPLNDEQQLQLGMVKRSASHLLDLINDVLDLSKIEAGEVELYPEPFDPRLLLEKTVRSLKPMAEKKSLALKTDVSPEVGLVRSDPRRVEQILINLVNNALKFTEEGEVRIECRVLDGTLLIRVIDTGIGIRPEDMAKLFVTFRQLDSTLGRKHEGTGLGLSICRKLAALLGGEVMAESTWGSGSTFTLVLPLNMQGEKGEEHRSD